jgi:hypothetical protein
MLSEIGIEESQGDQKVVHRSEVNKVSTVKYSHVWLSDTLNRLCLKAQR